MRAEQREITRKKILEATLKAVSEASFDSVSTREIAERAKVSQGLLTYHFKTKEELWRSAVDYMFARQNEMLKKAPALESTEPREQQRELIRQLVHICAKRPEIMRFMLEVGNANDERLDWLVDSHLRKNYQMFAHALKGIPKADLPHMYYIIAGASCLIFSASNQCIRLTGVDPKSEEVIKRHADFVANLIVPE